MEIDQRIEALTQSVELLATFHRDSEARLKAFEERSNASEARIDKLISAIETLTAHMHTCTH